MTVHWFWLTVYIRVYIHQHGWFRWCDQPLLCSSGLILRTEVTFLWRPIQKSSLVSWPLYNNSLFPASAKPVHPTQPPYCNVYYGLLLWFSEIWLRLPNICRWSQVLFFLHGNILGQKEDRPISLRLSSMYCSEQVLFLPSLSLKIIVGEGRSPGQTYFPPSLTSFLYFRP